MKWVGHTSIDQTWNLAKNIANTPKLVHEFHHCCLENGTCISWNLSPKEGIMSWEYKQKDIIKTIHNKLYYLVDWLGCTPNDRIVKFRRSLRMPLNLCKNFIIVTSMNQLLIHAFASILTRHLDYEASYGYYTIMLVARA